MRHLNFQQCVVGFPALGAGYTYLFWILIGSKDFFASVVIGYSDYFDFGFAMLNWKPLCNNCIYCRSIVFWFQTVNFATASLAVPWCCLQTQITRKLLNAWMARINIRQLRQESGWRKGFWKLIPTKIQVCTTSNLLRENCAYLLPLCIYFIIGKYSIPYSLSKVKIPIWARE